MSTWKYRASTIDRKGRRWEHGGRVDSHSEEAARQAVAESLQADGFTPSAPVRLKLKSK
ncbi:hypothetical protein [Streptomyces sp. NPDC056543]|uniref:hypothetical protein n=1 Tax=unclassified Streptomyces TaxID=2593676 RepID=UPI0036B9980D